MFTPHDLASFPYLLHLQFLIACSMPKWRDKPWGILPCDPLHNRIILSHIHSTAISDIWDKSYILCYLWRRDKCQQRATASIWNVPRVEAMSPKGYWVTSVKIPSSDIIILWRKRRHYSELYCLYHSHPSVVKLWTQISFTGKTYLSSGICFGSLTFLELWIRMWISCCV